jgi:oxygen-dependent protoporphyrinogen oxidase
VDVAIVGGGIAGLSAAWSLQQEWPQASYLLLERSARWGGKIQTETVTLPGVEQPFVVEGGPDSFITQKPWGVSLAQSLGMTGELLPTNDANRKVFVLNKGKPTPLPDGVLLIVPTRFMPFALSPLISPLGKLRMGMDLFVRPKPADEDETLAQFVRRRLGREALDKIAEPLMSGIYNADAEEQSLLATFPRFRALEVNHGSLIRGMLASMRERSAAKSKPAPANGAGNGPKPPTSLFVSMRQGMNQLVDEMVPQLTGDLRLNTGVQAIAQEEDGYRLTLSDGSQIWAAQVLLTTPTWIAADLLRSLAPSAAQGLDAIRYVSTGTVSLGFRLSELGDSMGGHGLVVPRSEQRGINAITWSSSKFEQRAPQGYALLRAFFGGTRSPQSMELDDDALLAMVQDELKSMLGITAQPLFHRIYRWHRANPQYDVGHLDRVAQIEASLPPGLFVTGSGYRGVGIPDCVDQAQRTVKTLCAAATKRGVSIATPVA